LFTTAFWAETRPRRAPNVIREVFMVDISLRSLDYLFPS
jgi:hypothetical protein